MISNNENLDYNSILEKIISNICNCEYRYFLNKKNVLGVGCAYKLKNHFRTNQLCIQVLVTKKIPENYLSNNDIIPKTYKGIPTDIKETGEITAYSLTCKKRPVLGGYAVSVANYDTYGTTSCLVTNGVSNFLLSTNHILTNEGIFDMGTPIIQPAHFYGGKQSKDTIANLNKFIPLRPIEGQHRPINLSDCALGLLTKPNILSPEIALIGKLTGVVRPKLTDRVKKVGAISELTEGVVNGIHASVTVRLPSLKTYLFQDIITTNFMLSRGDSGSLLVSQSNRGLGIGIGGSDIIDVYCCLDIVLDQLDVKLVT